MTQLNYSFDNEGKGIVLDECYVFSGLALTQGLKMMQNKAPHVNGFKAISI